jgi:AraC family transcriptional regulator
LRKGVERMGSGAINVNTIKDSASSLARSSCQALAYGEFYGVFERLYEIPDFSLAVIAPDEIWMKGVKHSHRAAHFIFVLDGHYVLSSDTHERPVPPRSLIFVPAGTTHRNYPKTIGTRILTVSISDSQVEQARDYVRLPEAESDFRHGEIGFLATRLETECGGWQNTSPLTAAGLCLELLAATAKRTATNERKPPRWLLIARELLHDKCCDTVSISEVAEAAGVHPIHLSRTFRKFFHCTPGEYLRQCRIERATSLLRFGHRSIAQVACESGFGDQSQLSKAFRRTLGITPAEFRLNSSCRV